MSLSKAEGSFRYKLANLMVVEAYVHDLGGTWHVLGDEGEIHVCHPRPVDVESLEKLLVRYGYHLELIGWDDPIEQTIVFEFKTIKYAPPSSSKELELAWITPKHLKKEFYS